MITATTATKPAIALGLRENWPLFTLLILINAFVGGMVGIERTLVPLIGSEEFGLTSTTLVTSFIISFGLVKALSNLVSGQLADRWGRKRVLILGGYGIFGGRLVELLHNDARLTLLVAGRSLSRARASAMRKPTSSPSLPPRSSATRSARRVWNDCGASRPCATCPPSGRRS